MIQSPLFKNRKVSILKIFEQTIQTRTDKKKRTNSWKTKFEKASIKINHQLLRANPFEIIRTQKQPIQTIKYPGELEVIKRSRFLAHEGHLKQHLEQSAQNKPEKGNILMFGHIKAFLACINAQIKGLLFDECWLIMSSLSYPYKSFQWIFILFFIFCYNLLPGRGAGSKYF